MSAPPPGSAGTSAPEERIFTPAEERANWIIHTLGLLLSLPGAALLVLLSLRTGDAGRAAGSAVFGLTLITLYASSAAYHACRAGRKKALLCRLDHAAIFLLIAGTYTPFLLSALRGSWGWTLFGIIWGLCGTGAVLQLLFFSSKGLRRLSTPLYLFTGWLIIAAFKPLAAALPPAGLLLLLAGGLCYTFGIIFYRRHSMRHHHAVWHGFVLAGSICHFLSVLLFLPPRLL